MSVTDGDRTAALKIAGFDERWTYAQAPRVSEPADMELVDRIATALATERERVLAPFLALAEELDRWQDNARRFATASKEDAVTGAMARARAAAYQRATEGIRATAKES